MFFSVLGILDNSLFRTCLIVLPLARKAGKIGLLLLLLVSLGSKVPEAKGRKEPGPSVPAAILGIPGYLPSFHGKVIVLMPSPFSYRPPLHIWAPSKTRVLWEICRIRSPVWNMAGCPPALRWQSSPGFTGSCIKPTCCSASVCWEWLRRALGREQWCLFSQFLLPCGVQSLGQTRPLYLVVSCLVSNHMYFYYFCHLTLWGIIRTEKDVGLQFLKAAREGETADCHLHGQEENPQSMVLKQCLSFHLFLTQKNNVWKIQMPSKLTKQLRCWPSQSSKIIWSVKIRFTLSHWILFFECSGGKVILRLDVRLPTGIFC